MIRTEKDMQKGMKIKETLYVENVVKGSTERMCLKSIGTSTAARSHTAALFVAKSFAKRMH